MTGDEEDGRGLAAAVLEEEARREAGRTPAPTVVLPDDLLPGVGGDQMSVREGLKLGGGFMITALMLVNVIETFELREKPRG